MKNEGESLLHHLVAHIILLSDKLVSVIIYISSNRLKIRETFICLRINGLVSKNIENYHSEATLLKSTGRIGLRDGSETDTETAIDPDRE